jgi:hypothetical protein
MCSVKVCFQLATAVHTVNLALGGGPKQEDHELKIGLDYIAKLLKIWGCRGELVFKSVQTRPDRLLSLSLYNEAKPGPF